MYARDPAAWLCFLTARRQVGRFAEADAFVSEYFKQSPGAVTMAAASSLPCGRLKSNATDFLPLFNPSQYKLTPAAVTGQRR